MMAGIRSTNTKPERLIRSGLHRAGFRFRLHDRRVPGRPDLVLAQHRAAIFVHGCFWHGHDCSLYKIPAARRDFWSAKIARNRMRDQTVQVLLRGDHWRQLTIWECSFRGPHRLGLERVLERAAQWIVGGSRCGEIRGRG